MSVYVHRAHACLVFICGVRGLSSQCSLMPQHPGQSLDGITGNWIVFHLLWKQPGRNTLSLLQYLQLASTSPHPPPCHCIPVPIPLWRHTAPKACFYMSSKVSPCYAEMLGWMSTECSIKQLPLQYQQQQQQGPSSGYHITIMGWSNMLRSSTDRN